MKTRNFELNEQTLNHQPGKSSVEGQRKVELYSALSLPTVLALLLTLGTALAPTPAAAGTLGNPAPTPLTIPSSCPSAPGCGTASVGVFPTVTVGSPFTGTWPAGVDPGYGNHFTGTGSYPVRTSGTDTFDFTTLTHGSLPKGTLFVFGDLDDGSGPENFTLQAWDANHNPIATSGGWLNDAFYVSGNASDWVQASMPEYHYVSGEYLFDGDNLQMNPAIAVWLTTNTDIGYLTVTSNTSFASFNIGAPVPEPGSLLLMGSGVVGLGGLLRRRLLG